MTSGYRISIGLIASIALCAVSQGREYSATLGQSAFDIHSQTVVRALVQFTQQSGVQLLLPTDGIDPLEASGPSYKHVDESAPSCQRFYAASAGRDAPRPKRIGDNKHSDGRCAPGLVGASLDVVRDLVAFAGSVSTPVELASLCVLLVFVTLAAFIAAGIIRKLGPERRVRVLRNFMSLGFGLCAVVWLVGTVAFPVSSENQIHQVAVPMEKSGGLESRNVSVGSGASAASSSLKNGRPVEDANVPVAVAQTTGCSDASPDGLRARRQYLEREHSAGEVRDLLHRVPTSRQGKVFRTLFRDHWVKTPGWFGRVEDLPRVATVGCHVTLVEHGTNARIEVQDNMDACELRPHDYVCVKGQLVGFDSDVLMIAHAELRLQDGSAEENGGATPEVAMGRGSPALK